MNAIETLRISLTTAQAITNNSLQDLTDQEMLHRPHPNSNHLKWQLGHLILSNHRMIGESFSAKLPPLPDGFVERYGKENAGCDQPDRFDSKQDLVRLFQRQQAAIKDLLEQLTPDDLDLNAPQAIRNYAPTMGAALALIPLHWMMHAGQWAVIRRQLGRPPLL